jgi:hypothetical protein
MHLIEKLVLGVLLFHEFCRLCTGTVIVYDVQFDLKPHPDRGLVAFNWPNFPMYVKDCCSAIAVISSCHRDVADTMVRRPHHRCLHFRYFGSAVFAMEGIALLLPVENAMAEPHLFPNVRKPDITLALNVRTEERRRWLTL